MMEVIHKRDGMTVRSLAHYSYRRGPIGEWMVGEAMLYDLDVVEMRPARDPLYGLAMTQEPLVDHIERCAAQAWEAGL